MKSDLLQNAIGKIDDDLIEDADVKKSTMKKTNIIRWVSIAAAACLIIVAVFAIAPMLRKDVPSTTVTSAVQTTGSAEGFGDPNYQGSEIGMYEKYKYAVDEGKYAGYEMGRVINADKVGKKLADVSVTAGWVRRDVWENNEHARAEIYEISGVSDGTAVAIRFLDKLEAETTEHYYVIINPAADKTPVQKYVIEENPSEMNDGAE